MVIKPYSSSAEGWIISKHFPAKFITAILFMSQGDMVDNLKKKKKKNSHTRITKCCSLSSRWSWSSWWTVSASSSPDSTTLVKVSGGWQSSTFAPSEKDRDQWPQHSTCILRRPLNVFAFFEIIFLHWDVTCLLNSSWIPLEIDILFTTFTFYFFCKHSKSPLKDHKEQHVLVFRFLMSKLWNHNIGARELSANHTWCMTKRNLSCCL